MSADSYPNPDLERVVTRRPLTDNEAAINLRYWLSRPPKDRADIEALNGT